MNYLVLRNGCLDAQGRIVVITSEARKEEPHAVVSSEDYDRLSGGGFLHNLPILQTSLDEAAVRAVRYMDTTAALVRPYYANNIFHHFQSLAGLLQYDSVMNATSTASRTGATGGPLGDLRYVLMPGYDPAGSEVYEWTNSVLSLVTSQMDQSHPGDRPLSVVFEGEFKALFAHAEEGQETEGKAMVCFKGE
jgi:hypothetical protein